MINVYVHGIRRALRDFGLDHAIKCSRASGYSINPGDIAMIRQLIAKENI